MDKKYNVDDRGNEANFFKKLDDGSWEKAGRLDREAFIDGKTDQLTWENFYEDQELEEWMRKNHYDDELNEAKRI